MAEIDAEASRRPRHLASLPIPSPALRQSWRYLTLVDIMALLGTGNQVRRCILNSSTLLRDALQTIAVRLLICSSSRFFDFYQGGLDHHIRKKDPVLQLCSKSTHAQLRHNEDEFYAVLMDDYYADVLMDISAC